MFFSAITAFVLTIVMAALALHLFPRWKLLDRPSDYGLTRKPIPYSVGLVFYVVFVVIALFFTQLTSQLVGLLLGGGLIILVSFIDDRFRIHPLPRLAAQVVAAIIVIAGGVKIQLVANPFGKPFFLDTFSFVLGGQTIWILSALLIIVWLVLMMNVMNWLDGVPGQASGISFIAFTTLCILSLGQFHVVDQTTVIILSSALAASSLAFWFFDVAPPRLLMGDSGSMFLGFALGGLSILAGGKLATALLVMGFPVIDAFFVIIGRLMRGRSPMKGDPSHLHDRLRKARLTDRQILLFNYTFSALFAIIALAIPSTLAKAVAFGMGLLILAVMSFSVSKF